MRIGECIFLISINGWLDFVCSYIFGCAVPAGLDHISSDFLEAFYPTLQFSKFEFGSFPWHIICVPHRELDSHIDV